MVAKQGSTRQLREAATERIRSNPNQVYQVEPKFGRGKHRKTDLVWILEHFTPGAYGACGRLLKRYPILMALRAQKTALRTITRPVANLAFVELKKDF